MEHQQIFIVTKNMVFVNGWGIGLSSIIFFVITFLAIIFILYNNIKVRKHKSYPIVLRNIHFSRVYKLIYDENKVRVFPLLFMVTDYNPKLFFMFFLFGKNNKSKMVLSSSTTMMYWEEENKRWRMETLFVLPIGYATDKSSVEIIYVNENFE